MSARKLAKASAALSVAADAAVSRLEQILNDYALMLGAHEEALRGLVDETPPTPEQRVELQRSLAGVPDRRAAVAAVQTFTQDCRRTIIEARRLMEQ